MTQEELEPVRDSALKNGSDSAITTFANDVESTTLGFSANTSSAANTSLYHDGALTEQVSWQAAYERKLLSPSWSSVYPKILSAMELLDDSDGESTYCGPPSEPDQCGLSELHALQAWGIGVQEEEPPRRRKDRRNDAENRRKEGDGEGKSIAASLVLPRGPVQGDNLKYICVFQIGLEDDEEFCLVKRILGKAGNNMRRIADDCNAKVRLRGIGSGFLEGADGREANMPLQLNVSCITFEEYLAAVDKVGKLLKDLYKHYRRYARSKGMEPPDVKLALEEVRRDDQGVDLLTAKANRSPSQRERDRRAREQERRLQREKEREKQPSQSSGSKSTSGLSGRLRAFSRDHEGSGSSDDYIMVEREIKQKAPRTLPSGQPVPTTPAGRRAAARTGGAAAAAVASAAAREAEREERERARAERDRKRREAEERSKAIARRPGRNAPRGGADSNSANYGEQDEGTWSTYSSRRGGGYQAVVGRAPPPPPGPPPDDAMPVSGLTDASGKGSSGKRNR